MAPCGYSLGALRTTWPSSVPTRRLRMDRGSRVHQQTRLGMQADQANSMVEILVTGCQHLLRRDRSVTTILNPRGLH